MTVTYGFRRRCGWCGVTLRGWQLNLCRRCKSAVKEMPGRLTSPPCKSQSRWEETPDSMFVTMRIVTPHTWKLVGSERYEGYSDRIRELVAIGAPPYDEITSTYSAFPPARTPGPTCLHVQSYPSGHATLHAYARDDATDMERDAIYRRLYQVNRALYDDRRMH